ncbi:MAG: response regulator [Bacteroidota bacterium]
MEKLKVLIVEDDNLLAQSISLFLGGKGYDVVGSVSSGEEAFELMGTLQPEIILVDIHLKGEMDGVQAVNKIHKKHDLIVIYITESDDDDIFRRAKATFPKNYLTKPFSMAQLGIAIDLAIAEYKGKDVDDMILKDFYDKSVFLYSKDNCYQKVLVEDICIIEAQGAFSKIFLLNSVNPLKVSISSNNIVRKFKASFLIRVHRSFYVNPLRVDAIENKTIIIANKKVPIGLQYYKDTLSHFNIIKR